MKEIRMLGLVIMPVGELERRWTCMRTNATAGVAAKDAKIKELEAKVKELEATIAETIDKHEFMAYKQKACEAIATSKAEWEALPVFDPHHFQCKTCLGIDVKIERSRYGIRLNDGYSIFHIRSLDIDAPTLPTMEHECKTCSSRWTTRIEVKQ